MQPEFKPKELSASARLKINLLLGTSCGKAVEHTPPDKRGRGFESCWVLGFFLLLSTPSVGTSFSSLVRFNTTDFPI